MSGTQYDHRYVGEGGDRDVLLSDCLTEPYRITNTEFINCVLIGPAVVAIQNCQWSGGFNLIVSPQAAAESAFWIPTEDIMFGLLGIENCRFENVHWAYVGFVIADENERQKMLENVTLARMEADL